MFQMPTHEIGGAIVRRTFQCGAKRVTSGQRLTGDEVKAMPVANRNALVEKKYMDLIPNGGGVAAKGERFVISAGFGRFYVVEGRKLNAESLDREQAYALAGTAAPAPKGSKTRK